MQLGASKKTPPVSVVFLLIGRNDFAVVSASGHDFQETWDYFAAIIEESAPKLGGVPYALWAVRVGEVAAGIDFYPIA